VDTPWPTILALVFAAIAALVAARSLIIQSSEHKRLVGELSKRADFALTIRPMGSPYNRIGPDSADLSPSAATVLGLCFEIGLSNTGERAANHTVLNVLVSQRFSNLQWCAANCGKLAGQLSAATTSEPVGPDDGEGSLWITERVERVALRIPELRFATFRVEMPAKGQSMKVQMRVKAESDDLPDDVDARVKDYTVNITRT
jgi:hypothetical protein